MTTGMVTKRVAIHRKHHAKCETEDDPHSPQTRGLKTGGAAGQRAYRAEAKNQETLASTATARRTTGWSATSTAVALTSGRAWPDAGPHVLLFGARRCTGLAIQMAWIPSPAAGIINGVGHYWGYRNFEAPTPATNVVPWGIIIGGEELHNNHHTYPTSAKFSVKPHEFDIGWMYIRILEILGWAKVRKTPKLALRRSAR